MTLAGVCQKTATKPSNGFALRPEKGDVNAQVALGNKYLEGEDVPKDGAEAAKWYRFAAEQGYDYAQQKLSKMYAEGLVGVPKDGAEAYKWISLASSKNEYYALQRDLLEEGENKLNSIQIAEGQRMAREWKPKRWEELKGQLE